GTETQPCEQIAEVEPIDQILRRESCDTGGPPSVVRRTLLRIGQDGIGLGDLFKALLGAGLLVAVRVVLQREAAERILDGLRVGVAWDAEHCVVVSLLIGSAARVSVVPHSPRPCDHTDPRRSAAVRRLEARRGPRGTAASSPAPERRSRCLPPSAQPPAGLHALWRARRPVWPPLRPSRAEPFRTQRDAFGARDDHGPSAEQ